MQRAGYKSAVGPGTCVPFTGIYSRVKTSRATPPPPQFLLSTGQPWAGQESEVILTSSQQRTQGVLQPIWLPVARASRVHDLLVLGMRYTAILL